MPDILAPHLTPAQRRAIGHAGGPLLIVAGPGAGKTDVMVRRAAHLVRDRGVPPDQILVTTFTNKAADELYDRLYPFLGKEAHDLHISTIHSFCQTLLQRYPSAHPWGAGFQVLDAQAQFLFVYARLGELGLGRFPKGRLGEFVSDVVSTFNLCTEEQVDPEALVELADERGTELLELKKPKPEAVEEYAAVTRAYLRYLELLEQEGLLDFGMLQKATYTMLTEHPQVRDEVAATYRWLMVDEYQDTNRLQVLILREVARPRNEICAVGDDDQSIYRFRGASIRSFLRFDEDFPGAEHVTLDVNFRSTRTLVEAASALISHNAPDRAEKQLTAHRTLEAPAPVLIHRECCADEAESVVDALARWREEGVIRSYDDVALLLRSVKYHAGEYLEALERRGVPYVVVADGGFFDREDVLQLKDLLTFCGWKRRWDPRFFEGKVLGLDRGTLDALRRWHAKGEGDPAEWMREAILAELNVTDPRDRVVLRRMGEIRSRTLEGELDRELLRLFYELLRASGYLERCCAEGPCGEGDPTAESALLNLGQFSNLIARFQLYVRSAGTYRLGEYLRSLPSRSLDSLRPSSGAEAVRVMTVHQAKGLEFPVVVVGSAMEGRFPGRFRRPAYPVPSKLRLSGEVDSPHEHGLDQRRLFYVAMTRAETLLVVGAADKVSKRGGGPSRFIEEIGPERFRGSEHGTPTAVHRPARSRPPLRQRISYSALHSYLLCPLQFKLLHVCAFAPPQAHYFHFGTMIHRALELLHGRGKRREPVSPQVAEEVWRSVWRPGRSWSAERVQRMESTGLRYLRDYVTHFAGRFSRVCLVEEPLELPVPEAEDQDGLLITGRLDLALGIPPAGRALDTATDAALEVIDFKVRSRAGFEAIRPDYQLNIYALALNRKVAAPVERVVLHFLAESAESALEGHAWTVSRAAETGVQLAGAAQGILAGRFHATPGAHCRYCDWNTFCGASEARGSGPEPWEETEGSRGGDR